MADEPDTTGLIGDALTEDGHEVQSITSTGEVERVVAQADPDLIVLDTDLEQSDGLLLCTRLRARTDIPIVLLLGPTRRKADPIIALRLGASDFIAKPFEREELVARVEAVLRRTQDRSAKGQVRLGDLVIDRPGHRVLVGRNTLSLTPTEYSLLSHLASDPERVFTRDELAREVWGYADPGPSRIADVHILRLRQKLERAGGNLPRIQTVRGFGYRLSVEARGSGEAKSPAPGA